MFYKQGVIIYGGSMNFLSIYPTSKEWFFSVEKFIGLMVLSLYYFLSPYTDNYTTIVVILSSYYLYVIILQRNYNLSVMFFTNCRFYDILFKLISVMMR